MRVTFLTVEVGVHSSASYKPEAAGTAPWKFMSRTTLATMTVDKELGIAEMEVLAGLSTDTLRWYEREGILPAVGRGSSGQRRYGPQERDLVLLLTSLRETGMSTAMMKTFVQLLMEGAASHGRRINLLEQARELLEERRHKIDQAQAALERKVMHYKELIAAGLDCDGAPVSGKIRILQAARG
jgi:DNA-binding transcriptional MerR regulator